MKLNKNQIVSSEREVRVTEPNTYGGTIERRFNSAAGFLKWYWDSDYEKSNEREIIECISSVLFPEKEKPIKRNGAYVRPVWKSAEGYVFIEDMESNHLCNAYNLGVRCIRTKADAYVTKKLYEEIKRRRICL